MSLSKFNFFCFPQCCKGDIHSINIIDEASSSQAGNLNIKQPDLQLLSLSIINNDNNNDNSAFNRSVSKQSVKSQKSHQETAIFSLKNTLVNNDYIPDALSLSFSEIDKAPRLVMKEKKGSIFNNEQLSINAFGLLSKDEHQLSSGGLTFFWCKNSEAPMNQLLTGSGSGFSSNTLNVLQTPKHTFINANTNTNSNVGNANVTNANSTYAKMDYRLNVSYPDNKFNNYLFLIYYTQDTQSYKLKFNHIMRPSMTTKPDILIKLTDKNPIPIVVSLFVYFAECKLLLKTLGNGILEISDIVTKKKTVYSPLTTQIITIGKGKDCTLPIHHCSSIGNVQVLIVYDCFKKQWMLQNTNSTIEEEEQLNQHQQHQHDHIDNWYFGIDSYDINSVIEVKVFDSLFSIEVVY